MSASPGHIRLVVGIVGALAAIATPARAALITGAVVDTDGTPIAGAVVVYEDSVFARTAADGSFALDAPGAGQVWVRAPDGFSPAPTWVTVGAGGASGIELRLARRAVALPLTFVHVSDLHVGVVAATDLIDPLAQATQRTPRPHFVMASGDLSQSSAMSELVAVRDVMATLDVPFVPGLGNHDWLDNGTAYRAVMGPPAYSFDAGGVHFIVLHGNAPVARRLAFVQADMAFTPPGTLTVAFIHYPLALPYDQELYDGLVAAGVTHLFTGHFHANRTVRFPGLVEHNIQPLAMGGIELIPAGYEVVTIDGAEVHTSTEFVVDAPVFEIMQPVAGRCIARDAPVVVAYAGSADVTLAATIDDASIALERSGGWDYRSAAAEPSLGPHHLIVTATDRLGTQTREVSFCVAPRVVPACAGTTWDQLQGGPEHPGALARRIEPPLDVAWTTSVGGFVRGSPVVGAGRLFVPVADYGTDAHGGIVALDAATGAVLWDARIGEAVDTPLAIAGDRVIAVAADGVVRALDAGTGSVQWEHPIGAGLPESRRSIRSGPTVADGVVYAGNEYELVALDAVDGAVLWQIAPSAATFPSIDESTVAVGDGVLAGVFSAGKNGVVGLDATTGTERWRYDDPATDQMQAPPAIDGDAGRIVLATGDGQVVSASASDGSEAWRTTVVPGGFDFAIWSRSAPAVAGDRYVVATQRGASALDRDTGALAWAFAPPAIGPLRTEHYLAHSAVFSSAPLITDDVVWMGGDDGVVRAIDRGTGAQTWSIELGAPILSGIVPSASAGGATLFVATWDGTVHALTSCGLAPSDGELTAANPGCGCTSSSGGGYGLVVIVLAVMRRRVARRIGR